MRMNTFQIVFICCVFSLSACQQDSALPPPNILWITNEDTGLSWGCYGDSYANTPNIDQLASDGFIFTQAFSNAPICAPARSTLITGMYATSLGTQHLRSEIPVPRSLKILPELLSRMGYHTTNNSKTDYNFSPEGRWDENSSSAHWRNAPKGSPFFSVFNFGITHEGRTNRLDPQDTQGLPVRHDPDDASLPPYYPDTPKFRKVWAHMNDLMSVFDQEVGKLINQLKEDGEYENTIVFVFSDHGYGLPRFKRWLYNSGMHVPFVLHVPDKYKHLVSNLKNQKVDELVSFVDMAPTVLSLAGLEPTEMMEGRSFLGQEAVAREFVYGYRSRADDCYDMSRSIYDGRYIYIRNFMPHRSYIQNAVIFNRGKASYEELFRLRNSDSLPQEAVDMFMVKPVEELYDLQEDPYELNNIIEDPAKKDIAMDLKRRLYSWMRRNHDTGLWNEGEMMMRSRHTGSVYEMARSQDVSDILESADLVGYVDEAEKLVPYLESRDPGIKYWALVALDACKGEIASVKPMLITLLNDTSTSVSILAAELLVKRMNEPQGLEKLLDHMRSEYEPVVLQAAISLRLIGTQACPLLPEIQNEIMPKFTGDVWGRYKNWFYPMFIGMALDQVQINCGEEIIYGG